MAWLQRCRLPMVIRACDAKAADARHCCPALLPARKIAGQSIRTPGAAERAPWIRVSRLRVANLRLTHQRSGNDKKRTYRHARHGLFSCRRSSLLSHYQFVWSGGTSASTRTPGGGSPLPPVAPASRPELFRIGHRLAEPGEAPSLGGLAIVSMVGARVALPSIIRWTWFGVTLPKSRSASPIEPFGPCPPVVGFLEAIDFMGLAGDSTIELAPLRSGLFL